MRGLPRRDLEDSVSDVEVHSAGGDIYLVRFHWGCVIDFTDRHRGGAGKDLGKQAFVLRIEMLDQHESHSRIAGQGFQEFRECF